MARIAIIALSVAVTLAVPAILAVNGIRLLTNDRYVEAVYDYGGVPDDRYGLAAADRERLALVGLRSIEPSSAEGIGLLREARLPNGEPAFNARELAHMEDVRRRSRAYRFQIIAVIAIGILALLLGLLSTTRAVVPVALVRGAVLTVVVAVVVSIVAATSYGSFETPFHSLFFEGRPGASRRRTRSAVSTRIASGSTPRSSSACWPSCRRSASFFLARLLGSLRGGHVTPPWRAPYASSQDGLPPCRVPHVKTPLPVEVGDG